MTTVSTLAAAVMTPALTGLLVGTLVPVDTLGLLVSTLQVRACAISTAGCPNKQMLSVIVLRLFTMRWTEKPFSAPRRSHTKHNQQY